MFVTGLLQPGDWIRSGRRIQAYHSETVTITKRYVCVLALVLVFLAGGVASMPSRETRAQESPPLGRVLFDNGLKLQTMADLAWADVVVGSNQVRMDECSCYASVLSARRFKTH